MPLANSKAFWNRQGPELQLQRTSSAIAVAALCQSRSSSIPGTGLSREPRCFTSKPGGQKASVRCAVRVPDAATRYRSPCMQLHGAGAEHSRRHQAQGRSSFLLVAAVVTALPRKQGLHDSQTRLKARPCSACCAQVGLASCLMLLPTAKPSLTQRILCGRCRAMEHGRNSTVCAAGALYP